MTSRSGGDFRSVDASRSVVVSAECARAEEPSFPHVEEPEVPGREDPPVFPFQLGVVQAAALQQLGGELGPGRHVRLDFPGVGGEYASSGAASRPFCGGGGGGGLPDGLS